MPCSRHRSSSTRSWWRHTPRAANMHGVRAFINAWRGLGHEGTLRVYLFAKLHRERKQRRDVDPQRDTVDTQTCSIC